MARRERQVVSQNVLDSANLTQINVLFTNGTVWTKTVRIDDAVAANFSCVMGLVAATGSAKMTVAVEQSHEEPLVEGSAHPSFIITDTVQNTFATVSTYSHNAVTLRGFKYARCRITPVTPNTSAYVNIYFNKQIEG